MLAVLRRCPRLDGCSAVHAGAGGILRVRRSGHQCQRQTSLYTRRRRPDPVDSAAASLPRIRSRPSTTLTTLTTALDPARAPSLRGLLPPELTGSDAVRAALPYLGNGAYIALASGFLCHDMLTLRLALAGGYTGLVAFHALHSNPLRIPLRWSAVFVAVNAGMAAYLYADQCGPGRLSDENERMYQESFPLLTRGQFHALLELATEAVVPEGTRLTSEGVASDRLYFICEGRAHLYLNDRYAKTLDEGSFVNVVAFQQGDDAGAYGTVAIVGGDARVLEWDLATLRKHLDSRTDMDRNMRHCMTAHLVRGLLRQRKAAHDKWGEDQ